MNTRRTGLANQCRLWLFIACLYLFPACLTQYTQRPESELFTPLAAQKLSDFEQILAHYTLLGAAGDAIELAHEWLYGTLCVYDPSTRKYESPLWQALALGLYIEKHRPESVLLQAFQTVDLKNFQARSLNSAEWTTWPQQKSNREGWSDEIPTWLNLSSQCAKSSTNQKNTVLIKQRLWLFFQFNQLVNIFNLSENNEQLFGLNFSDLDQLLTLNQIEQLLNQELKESDRAKKGESQAQPLSETVNLEEWQWWIQREQALIFQTYSGVEIGWPPLLEKMNWYQSQHYSQACQLWIELHQKSSELLKQVDQTTHLDLFKASAQSALNAGLCHLALKHSLLAYDAFESAVAFGQDERAPQTLSLARYHQLRLLIDQGRYQEAILLKTALPSPQSPLYTPFVFSLGEAMSYSGQEAGLMSLCTDVFRDLSWRKDPFLRALFYLFVRQLTRYEFTGEVLELLEDLGPRIELYERVFIFAHVALDEGAEPNGSAAARWLLGQHDSALWRPRYHALKARAAILRLDDKAFVQALNTISPVQGKLLDAIQEGRRSTFFEQQDAALVELLQVEIPKIAGWPTETQKLKAQRIKWLDLIAQEMQIFLRKRPETKVRKELLSLYRSIRQNLPIGRLRAYSEQVGRDQARSVLIGYVRVRGVDLSKQEPRHVLFPRVEAPAFTLIPQSNLSPSTWPLRWPSQKVENQTK